ncbi:hypothetical protein B0H16DRAFT_1763171, partial [Mycena metata]
MHKIGVGRIKAIEFSQHMLSASKDGPVTLLSQDITRVAGEIIQGHVELNFALAQGDSLEQLCIEFKGTIYLRIVVQTGNAAIGHYRTITLFQTKIPLWSQGAVPEPGTDILTLFHCSATSRGATIGYSLEIVGERSGFHRMNRRIRRLISVVPQSQLLVKETLTQGWNGPWREIAQEEKLRQGLW